MTSRATAPRSASSTREVVDDIGRSSTTRPLPARPRLVVEGGGGQLRGGFFYQLVSGGAALSSGGEADAGGFVWQTVRRGLPSPAGRRGRSLRPGRGCCRWSRPCARRPPVRVLFAFMTISVELSNLGPLRSAKADIADLTLLIGKNNTGKTFFATVLHRVINASSPFRPIRWPLQDVPPVLQEWIENQISAYLNQQEGKPSYLETPSEEILEWVNNAADASLKMFGTSILNDIEYAFGAEAHELRRRTPSRRASDCYLRISNTDPDWKIEIRFDSDDIVIQGPDPNYLLSTLPEKIQLTVEEGPQKFTQVRGQEFERNSSFHMSRLYRRWLSSLYEGWPQRAVHLPADRTGIMQSHQVLGSALVRQATEAGIRPIEIESLPGTSADFLSLLINPRGRYFRRRNDKTSGFRASIKRLEEKMRATIRLDRKEDSRDIIVAVTPEGEFPMSRTSSMISELSRAASYSDRS